MAKSDFIHGKSWAVIGANDDPDRFGFIIYHHLKSAGYLVFAVNPKYQTVDGDPCYPDLKSLPQKPDAVDFVVAPAAGEKYIREAAELGILRLWFQPGTWRPDFADLTADLKLEVVRSCVLTEI
ncbi:MAG: CoA-binding protein [Eubacteriales bacterium]|nr:CoA-binding protein [Eubacteriales bacterium]